jgi:hypothetical protein
VAGGEHEEDQREDNPELEHSVATQSSLDGRSFDDRDEHDHIIDRVEGARMPDRNGLRPACRWPDP